jgi:hypothetical protein
MTRERERVCVCVCVSTLMDTFQQTCRLQVGRVTFEKGILSNITGILSNITGILSNTTGILSNTTICLIFCIHTHTHNKHVVLRLFKGVVSDKLCWVPEIVSTVSFRVRRGHDYWWDSFRKLFGWQKKGRVTESSSCSSP